MADDLKSRLESLESHFNWGMSLEDVPLKDAVESAHLAIQKCKKYPERVVRRFALCLHAAYVMCITGKDEAADKLLLIADSILEHSRDPSLPSPRINLERFLLKWDLERMWELCVDELDDSDTDLDENDWDDPPFDSDEEEYIDMLKGIHPKCSYQAVTEMQPIEPVEGSSGLWNENGFTGMYDGAKHVVLSLKTIMLSRKASQLDEVRELLACVPNISGSSDLALIRYLEAQSWRMIRSVTKYVPAFTKPILMEPSEVKWYVVLMKVLQTLWGHRRRDRERKVDEEDVKVVLEACDLVLDMNPEPWIVTHLNFEKLRAVNDYMVSSKRAMPFSESERLHKICFDLCEKLMASTTQNGYLAYCAQFLSTSSSTMELAVSTIEKALATEVDHDRTYVNEKAYNIFKKVGRMEEALACAEIAAQEAFGSNWQVLELKTRLDHDVNEQFFNDIRKKCSETTHIEQLHLNAFLYYICKTNDVENALRHAQKVVKLASRRMSKDIGGTMFCSWIQNDVNIAEAVYNVASYVLSGDYKKDEIELSVEAEGMCGTLKETLERKYLRDGLSGKLTPKEYVQWLRSSGYSRSNRAESGGRGHSSNERENDHSSRARDSKQVVLFQLSGITVEELMATMVQEMTTDAGPEEETTVNMKSSRGPSCGKASPETSQPN